MYACVRFYELHVHVSLSVADLFKNRRLTYHDGIGVDHSNQCNTKQNTDKFERVLRKLEVRRFGKENGSYQIAFRRGEA